MKKAVIIILSPRKKGTSILLADLCCDYLNKNNHQVEMIDLYLHLKDMGPILKEIDESDTIIMVGPCYIDTFPADTVNLLEQIIKNKTILHGQNLYGIIQGGMPTIHTHESGLKMLDLFCRDSDITYKGGFVLGMGAMLNGQPLEKLPNSKKVIPAFNQFLNHIAKGENSPEKLYRSTQLKLPGVVWRYLANGMNNRIDNELKEKGLDPAQPSPYLELAEIKK